MGDLISRSEYREKLVDYNRHLAAREEKATAEEDYEELNAINQECRAYWMLLSFLENMPSYDAEVGATKIREMAIDEFAEKLKSETEWYSHGGYALPAVKIKIIAERLKKGE